MENAFFAASNSAEGFKNYYGECFDRADRLYIIKGGPGTGKSTLMRRVADIATSKGMYTERYFCSSDHTSFDGVLFYNGDEWVGMLDGTAPHPYTPKFPGLREQTVDTGKFWDREKLKQSEEKIRYLCSEKSRCYNSAYSYLRACGNLSEAYASYTPCKVNSEKISRTVGNLIRQANGDGARTQLPALVNCIGMLGAAHFETFERSAEKIYVLCGEDGARTVGARSFLNEVCKSAAARGCSVRLAYDPIYTGELDGVFVENQKLWFVKQSAINGADEKYREKIKRVNMQRFIKEQSGGIYIKEKKHCKKLCDMCVEGARKSLALAGERHFELEEIYKSAMDFGGLEKYAGELCEKIFD